MLIRYASATPVITAGAYSAKDAVGGKLTFSEVSGRPNDFTYLLGLLISDKADVKAALSLFLFNNTNFNAVADNAGFDPADSDLANYFVGKVDIASTDYSSLTDNAVGIVRLAQPLPILCDAQRRVFGQLMCTATPTYNSTSDLTIKLILGLPA